MSLSLLASGIQVSNQVFSILLLLESGVDHLGTGDVLLWVGQINVQGLVVPGDALVDVGLGVGKTRSLASLSSNDSMEVGPLLVLASSFNSVALGTGLGENLFSVIGAHFL